jgi:hypothetical protein
VLGTIVNGHVPVLVTPEGGASQDALDSFRHAYVDALHIAYAVAALTMRPTPPGASA